MQGVCAWVLLSSAASAVEPVDFSGAEIYASEVDGPVGQVPWWDGFEDPLLSEAIEEGLANNGTLASAWDRARQADALARQAFAPLLPSASLDVSAASAPCDGCTALPPTFAPDADEPDLLHNGSALFVAGWQVDVFGRQTAAWRASALESRAAKLDRENSEIAIAGMIAEAYLDVVTATLRVALIEDQVRAQLELLELMGLRYEQGSASGLDVLQQRQALARTEALLPDAVLLGETRARQLAALVGRVPGRPVAVSGALPAVQAMPPTGRPVDLLANRPELVAAEKRMEAQRARVLSAQLGLLPSVSLQANAGWTALWITERTNDTTYGFGGGVSVPLFAGGARHSAVRQARAARDISTHQYNQSVRDALADVEGRLVTDTQRRARLDAVTTQEKASRDAYIESRDRYLEGLDPYVVVLTSQNAQQTAELTRLQAHRDAIGARIQLHGALGGPWTQHDRPESRR
jgi:NodT family efflux transporter outer membrane factor (OMF) lipoprotein